MAGITSISSTSQNKTPYLMDQAQVSRSFPCDTLLKRGATVKLLSTGKVATVAAAADVVLGLVTVGNKVVGGKVTVQLRKAAIIIAKSSAAIALGALVDATGWDATLGETIVTTATGTGNSFGIALQAAGAANAEIEVAVL